MDQLGRFWADTGLFFLMPLNSKTYSILNILFMYDNKCLIGSIEQYFNIKKTSYTTVYLCILQDIFKWKSGYVGQFINSSNGRDRFLKPASDEKRFRSIFRRSNLIQPHNPTGTKTKVLHWCCWQILWTKCVTCKFKMLMTAMAIRVINILYLLS